MDDLSKQKHSKRIHQKEVYAKKQHRIAKAHDFPTPKSAVHAEVSATTCGNSNCVMCGNPRKMFGELSIQEKKFYQDHENI